MQLIFECSYSKVFCTFFYKAEFCVRKHIKTYNDIKKTKQKQWKWSHNRKEKCINSKKEREQRKWNTCIYEVLARDDTMVEGWVSMNKPYGGNGWEEWQAVKADKTMIIWMSVIQYVHSATLNRKLLWTEKSSHVSYHNVALGHQKHNLIINWQLVWNISHSVERSGSKCTQKFVQNLTLCEATWSLLGLLKYGLMPCTISKILYRSSPSAFWFSPLQFLPLKWNASCGRQEQNGTKLWWRREQKAENFQQVFINLPFCIACHWHLVSLQKKNLWL